MEGNKRGKEMAQKSERAVTFMVDEMEVIRKEIVIIENDVKRDGPSEVGKKTQNDGKGKSGSYVDTGVASNLINELEQCVPVYEREQHIQEDTAMGKTCLKDILETENDILISSGLHKCDGASGCGGLMR